MVKHSKEESYTNKAKSLVKYPKFKGKGKEQTKEESEENAEHDKPDRPKTYTVTKSPSSDDPSEVTRKDLTNLISKSKVLDNPELMSDLYHLVEKFLKENSAEE